MLQTCPCATDLSLQHRHSLCHIYIYISWIDLITTALEAAETLQMLLEADCIEDSHAAAKCCNGTGCANLVLHSFPHCLALSIPDFALQSDHSLLVVSQPLLLHLLAPQHRQLLQSLRIHTACHCHLHHRLNALHCGILACPQHQRSKTPRIGTTFPPGTKLVAPETRLVTKPPLVLELG